EEEDVQSAGQGAMRLERRVLARHRDEREVGRVDRGQGARRCRSRLALRGAPDQQPLHLGQDGVAQALLAVDGDDHVCRPRLGAGSQRRERAEVGGGAHDDLAGRDALVVAQRTRDAHEAHAVGVAIGQRADLPAHAATGAEPKTEGPSPSGTIHVPWWPRMAVAMWAASVMIALPPWSTKRAAPSIFGPMLPAGNSPSSRWLRASVTVSRYAARAAGVPKPISTRATLVTSTSMSACSDTAS